MTNQQTAATTQATAPAAQPATQEKALTYQSLGTEITLTKAIVRRMLCRGNADFTDEQINQFMLMCRANQLNPFLNEAYLTGYKNSAGTSDVSMIVSKEALMKRAEACDKYEGFRAGVIVRHKDGTLEDVEGSFYDDGDTLVGGWAQVYRSDRKFPVLSRVRLAEYDKGRATWKSMTATMIAKVAKVQALREAFPAQLGAMYTSEEYRAAAEEADATEILDERKATARGALRAVDMETGEIMEAAARQEQPAREAKLKAQAAAGVSGAPF